MDIFEQRELRELVAEARELGAEITITTDKYMQNWYKVKVGSKEHSCGTNEYSLRSWLVGFLMGMERQ